MNEEQAREHPYAPEPGDRVTDPDRGRTGRLLGVVAGKYKIRPYGSGEPWFATTVKLATENEILAEQFQAGHQQRSS